MTTIVLVVIGILLAAAAALMVAWYGGDAFSGGSVKAESVTLQNAGENVIAAASLHVATVGAPASDPGALVAAGMLRQPVVTGIGTPSSSWGSYDASGARTMTYEVSGLSDAVCGRVNVDMGRGGFAPTRPVGQMGCMSQDGRGNVFYAVVAGSASGVGQFRDADGVVRGGIVSDLGVGQRSFSQNDETHVVYQGDGNLCVYKTHPAQGEWPGIWCSMVYGYALGGMRFVDGAVETYDADGHAVWSSGAPGNPGSTLVVDERGSLAVYAADRRTVLWRLF